MAHCPGWGSPNCRHQSFSFPGNSALLVFSRPLTISCLSCCTCSLSLRLELYHLPRLLTSCSDTVVIGLSSMKLVVTSVSLCICSNVVACALWETFWISWLYFQLIFNSFPLPQLQHHDTLNWFTHTPLLFLDPFQKSYLCCS